MPESTPTIFLAGLLADTMARYTLQPREQGVSPRSMSGIYSDLDAAGMLVFMYDAPKVGTVLSCCDYPPWEIEFRHKISATARKLLKYLENSLAAGQSRPALDHENRWSV
jgi:hypothetical protein